MSHRVRGALIVLEGIDGAGKSTQARLLADALKRRGYDVVVLSEPTNSAYGRRIRELIMRGETDPYKLFELFLKDRQFNVRENILPALNSGKVVILDRFWLSTLVYQAEVGFERILKAHAFAPKPDLVIILDVKPEVALSRLEEKQRDAFERLDTLRELRKRYLDIVERLKGLMRIVVIDANRDALTVHREVLSHVLEVLEEVRVPRREPVLCSLTSGTR